MIFTDDNADQLVLHLRIMNDDDKSAQQREAAGQDDDAFLKTIENTLLNELALKGMSGRALHGWTSTALSVSLSYFPFPVWDSSDAETHHRHCL